MLAAVAAGIWFAPAAVVLTDLRDLPLEKIFAGIDGRVTSREAAWGWWGGIEYRDVRLCDRLGRTLVAVPQVVVDRGLLGLAMNPTDLGAVRLVGAEALVEVRHGGSGIEDVLAPWLAGGQSASGLPVAFELELVDAAVELVDLERGEAWRITDILAAGTLRPDATLAGWTISGRARPASVPVRDPAAAANRVASDRLMAAGQAVSAEPLAGGRPASAPAARADRLDRTTVAAGATAILARDGGWSVSSPDRQEGQQPRSLAIAATRVPLGITRVAATRFDAAHVLDGVADVRLDMTLPPAGTMAADGAAGRPLPRPSAEVGVTGVVSATRLSACSADTGTPLVTLDRGEMPLDLSIVGDRVTVRSLKIAAPLVKGEVSGRLRLPSGGVWEWAESLVGDDFALAVDIDLAAAAQAMPGGIVIRPDVRVTDGQLKLSAVSRADGLGRVLEVRAGASDLAAVQSVLPVGERPLRWSEPFTAWLRGRRGPGRGDRLRIEEARVASPAVEMAASGNAESSTVQWSIDLDRLVAEAREVLELSGVELAGTLRGRLDLERLATTGASRGRLSASISDFEMARPDRPAWKDDDVSIEAEGAGGLAGSAVLVDQGRVIVAAGADRLEATLTGGALVNVASLVAGAGAWLRAAPGGQAIAAECVVEGDLGRWQRRVEGLLPSWALRGVALGGFVKASASLAADGDRWRVTRAGGEVERLDIAVAGRQIAEPRAVASAAGTLHPVTGQIEISSAELLTATLSLRTGGLMLLPRTVTGAASGDVLVERLRGKLQWQADVARLEKWLVEPEVAGRWPAAGRAWGTAEMLETPLGLNVLVEATGSQLALVNAAASRTAAAQATPVWSEPRATLVVEVTRPEPQAAGRLAVNQFKLESSTLAVAAAGSIDDWSARRLVELGGSVAYDWEQVSRLLTPWTGGRLRLAGSAARPFTLRGPLGSLVADANGRLQAEDGDRQIRLPEDWLGDAGAVGRPAEKMARVALPVAPAGARGGTSLVDRLRAVSVDTQAGWTAAEVAGFQFAPGEMPVRFFEGQLAMGPFDLQASGGRVRGAPWLRLLPGPAELVVPPGRCLDRVLLTPQMCDRWVTWLMPLVGHSTHTHGLMSVDLGGARLPLADPFGGEASGQIILENVEATPGEHVRPLVNLLVKLQSAIDPRFAFGDKAVLLRVRPEPVTIRLADRRLWHEGLVMDSGQLVIRSGGSVGADGTLAMVVEVAFRGDIAGATPVVGQLLRTPLAIPLKGTVHRPQFDARAIDVMVGRIMENTAEAVIGPKLSRDLETLFGNPPPAEETQAPLALPQPGR
jgi:translocation and assembly module TamB